MARRLTPYDWVVVVYCAIVMALVFVARSRVPSWGAYVAAHGAIALACCAVAFGEPRSSSRLIRFLRDWDTVAYVPALFFMTCVLVHRVHPTDYDPQLIAIDRRIGGIALLKWMERIQTPFLTNLSKMLWVSYYFLPLIPAIPLYLRGRRELFRESKLFVMLSFLVCYLGYFAFPAQGPGYMQREIGVGQPRFEQSKVSSTLKEVIHEFEGEARDTFPSGHVMISAVVIMMCFRYRLRRATWVAVPLALGVIWATMYLRYHYLVDGGVGIVLVAAITGAGGAWHRAVALRSASR